MTSARAVSEVTSLATFRLDESAINGVFGSLCSSRCPMITLPLKTTASNVVHFNLRANELFFPFFFRLILSARVLALSSYTHRNTPSFSHNFFYERNDGLPRPTFQCAGIRALKATIRAAIPKITDGIDNHCPIVKTASAVMPSNSLKNSTKMRPVK